jgi:hypothetical protein
MSGFQKWYWGNREGQGYAVCAFFGMSGWLKMYMYGVADVKQQERFGVRLRRAAKG